MVTQTRRMCNESVCELCCAIPTLEMSDRILLTAYNMYTYLEPRFRKKLAYRDAVAFLKTKLNNRGAELIRIRIDLVAQHNEREHIVIHCEQSGKRFALETNHLRIRIENTHSWSGNVTVNAWNSACIDDQCQMANRHYFLRLIAPLIGRVEINGVDFYVLLKPFVGPRYFGLPSDWTDMVEMRDDYERIAAELCKAFHSHNNELVLISLPEVANQMELVCKFLGWIGGYANGHPKRFPWLTLHDRLSRLGDEIKAKLARWMAL